MAKSLVDSTDLDFADVVGAEWSTLGNRAPVALVLHGLEGSARSGYAFQVYHQRGYPLVGE